MTWTLTDSRENGRDGKSRKGARVLHKWSRKQFGAVRATRTVRTATRSVRIVRAVKMHLHVSRFIGLP